MSDDEDTRNLDKTAETTEKTTPEIKFLNLIRWKRDYKLKPRKMLDMTLHNRLVDFYKSKRLFEGDIARVVLLRDGDDLDFEKLYNDVMAIRKEIVEKDSELDWALERHEFDLMFEEHIRWAEGLSRDLLIHYAMQATAGHSSVSTNEENRPSWANADLEALVTGDLEVLPSTFFPRTDGVCLLYAGMIHSFHGESESGKSLLAQIETVRLINAGERVLYCDFESDAKSIVRRLHALGATNEAMINYLHLKHPQRKPSDSELPAFHEMLSNNYSLAVIDGVTDSLGMWGYSTNDNDDVTTWSREFPKKLAEKTGAAVVMIDHMAKGFEGKGRFAIGGQAKMAVLTGAAYTVEMTQPIGKSLRGEIVMWIGKDRHGSVKEKCGTVKSGSLYQAATVVITFAGDVMQFEVKPPVLTLEESAKASSAVVEQKTAAAFKAIEAELTVKRRKAFQILQDNVTLAKGKWATEIGGRKADAYGLIDWFLVEGYVEYVKSGTSELYRIVKEFVLE